jgi:hypothetical protein
MARHLIDEKGPTLRNLRAHGRYRFVCAVVDT